MATKVNHKKFQLLNLIYYHKQNIGFGTNPNIMVNIVEQLFKIYDHMNKNIYKLNL